MALSVNEVVFEYCTFKLKHLMVQVDICDYIVLYYIRATLTISHALENRNAYVFHNVGSIPYREQ